MATEGSVIGGLDTERNPVQLEARKILMMEADEALDEPECFLRVKYLPRESYNQIVRRYPNRQGNATERRQFQRDVALVCVEGWGGMTPGNLMRMSENALLHNDQFNGTADVACTRAEIIAFAESLDPELFQIAILNEALNRDAFARDVLIKKKSRSSSGSALADSLPSSAPAPTP